MSLLRINAQLCSIYLIYFCSNSYESVVSKQLSLTPHKSLGSHAELTSPLRLIAEKLSNGEMVDEL